MEDAIERITKKYKGSWSKEGKAFIIKYPNIGNGSAILDDLNEYFTENKYQYFTFKMKPSDKILEVVARKGG